MSNVSEIQFAVEKSVLDIGVKIVFLVIEGIDNTRISPEWMRKQQMRFISYRAMKQLITNFCSLLPGKSWMKRSNTVAAKAG